MKKIILSLALTVIIFAGCGGETKISEDKAKEIALSHAGLAKENVKFVKAEKDRENTRAVYDVEFYSADNKEYDYEIDAETGEIISYDFDVEDFVPSSGNASQDTSQQAESVSEDEARKIALAKVPGATEENIREFKKDIDDGREEYEGKIIYNDTEYEFEIDAKTGEVIKWETEPVNG